ncbi:hypothetical protein SUT007_14150 [Streptococcus parasuis]|nr:hypothetical protein SUT007_14150 [Streptococcus parasuis]
MKQSGDRLFQLNNLKRKIVDELFFIFRFLSRSPKGEEMNFGQQIKDLRKKEGLTQEQFALKLNVTRQAVSN